MDKLSYRLSSRTSRSNVLRVLLGGAVQHKTSLSVVVHVANQMVGLASLFENLHKHRQAICA